MNKDENYFAFLVRFSRREGQAGWLAVLENVHTHEKRHFSTEMDLMVYLLHALAEPGGVGRPAIEGEKKETG